MTEKMDFVDWQRDMKSSIGEGFTDGDVQSVIKRLHVLRFHIDRKGENIVSEINGTIVFVDRGYVGERVVEGDVWLCSAEFRNTVYYAMPLKKITSSMIMGLSDDIRESIIDSLWKSNRPEFAKVFAERYKDEMYDRARKEVQDADSTIIKSLQDRIADLEKQVEHSRIVIGQKSTDRAEDWIAVTSDEVEEGELEIIQAPVAAPQERPVQERPQQYWAGTPVQSAPGMPEMRYMEQGQTPVQPRGFRVERVSEETIRCDDFADGKYFVHINPSKRFLVIRRHDYGSAICVNGRIRLEGLGAYSSFDGPRQLMAEYNARYDGVLVYL